MKYIIPILLLVLIGCADPEEYTKSSQVTSHQTNSQTSHTQFSAPRMVESGKVKESWMSDCYDEIYEGSNVTYLIWHMREYIPGDDSNINFMWDRHIYDDSATHPMPCGKKTLAYSQEYETRKIIPKEEGKFELVMNKYLYITPKSIKAVNDYNNKKKCGYGNWALNSYFKCIIPIKDKLYCSYESLNVERWTVQALHIKCDNSNYPDNLSDALDLRFLLP